MSFYEVMDLPIRILKIFFNSFTRSAGVREINSEEDYRKAGLM